MHRERRPPGSRREAGCKMNNRHTLKDRTEREGKGKTARTFFEISRKGRIFRLISAKKNGDFYFSPSIYLSSPSI
jgi:hypothetical protein